MPGPLALFIPTLVGALSAAVATMVGRAIMAAGVGFVTYKGVDVSLNAIKADMISSMQGAGQIMSLVAYLWFDKGITLILSCCTAALALKVSNGLLKKVVLK